MRLFIAVEVPQALKNAVFNAIAPVKAKGADVRWVSSDGFHLTLKFLGEVDDKRVDGIRAAMEGLTPLPAVCIEVVGAGAFPGLKNPRVLWVGLKEPTGQLASLQAMLEKGLEEIGFPREARPFHPHLTVGRVKSSGRVKALAEGFGTMAGLSFGEFQLEEVVLYKSEQKPSGAVYTRIYAVRTAGQRR